MAQKQQEQKQSHADAIRLYWTPERIRSAVPEKHHQFVEPDNADIISVKKQAGGLENVPPIEVPDENRQTPPFQSVGKLMFNKGTINYQGTAYVVDTGKGNNIVFTAAHNLCDQNGVAENILFIPACQTDQQPVPEYGSFTQIPGGMDEAWIVATGWVPVTIPNKKYFDFGAIKLAKNEAGKDVGEVVPMLNFAVDLLPLMKPFETEWGIIGYRTNFDTNQDIMYQSSGVYIVLVDDQKTDARSNPVLDGMSGSPWLVESAGGYFTIANGVHSSSSPDFAYSPYFSKALVADIIGRL